jgi:murein DD-endopeptidase MepM/ murein hydrolase activator NlpD
MPHKNSLSHEHQNPNLTSSTQDQEISPTGNQTTYRSTRMLCLVLAVTATAIVFPNQHKPTLATNLKRQQETNNNYAKNPVKKKHKSWQSPDLVSSLSTNKTKANKQKYTIKVGDTLNQIAEYHNVSRDKLIQINNIKNSNIIFANQKLEIPTNTKKILESAVLPGNKQIANSPLPTASNLRTSTIKPNLLLASESQLSSVTESSSSADDPYIAKLRAEIDQLRTQYQNQTKDEQVTSSTIKSKTEKTAEHKNQKSSAAIVSVASVNRASYNHRFQSSGSEIVTPQLPPLYSPEHYLPSAFDGYDWPAKGVLTSGYGWRWGRLHQGIDIAAPIGTPVLAAASGEVISAGWDSGGYGNLIKIQHPDGSVTVYGHNNTILVTSGQKVVQGEQIAEMGSTGRSTGSHLHFEVRPQGDFAVNPMAFLASK